MAQQGPVGIMTGRQAPGLLWVTPILYSGPVWLPNKADRGLMMTLGLVTC